jgi:signal transduction histidine kinase
MMCFFRLWLSAILSLGITHSLASTPYPFILNSKALTPTQKIDSLIITLQKNFDNHYLLADSIAQLTIAMAEKINYTQGLSGAYVMLALIKEGQGKLVEAEQYCQQALGLMENLPKPKYRTLAEITLGTIYRRQSRKHDATQQYYKALAYAQQMHDSLLIRHANTSLAIMFVGEKEYDKAMQFHEEALRIALQMNHEPSIQKCYTNIGIVYARLKNYDRALQFHTKALALALKANDTRQAAFAYNDLGSTSLFSGDYETAIRHLKKSISMREDLQERNEIAYTYNYLGQTYQKIGNQREAISWLTKSLFVATEIGNNKQIGEALDQLSTVYASFSKYDSAYYYASLYQHFRDSIRQIEKISDLHELNIRYETSQKEQALAASKLKIQQRNNQLILIITISIILLLIGVIVYRHLYLTSKEFKLKAELADYRTLTTLQEDRLRIAQELHDNIGMHLTFVNNAIDEIQDNVPKESFDDIKKITKDAMYELRKTVWFLNKRSASLEEFIIKLRDYIPKNGKPYITIELKGNSQLVLTSKIVNHLFRFIQEGINNAIKHAQATCLTVNVEGGENEIRIDINDDGVGFSMHKATSGFGIQSMHKRIAEMHGSIKFETTSGTRITATIPLEVLDEAKHPQFK